MRVLIAVVVLCTAIVSPLAFACETQASVCTSSKAGSFPLIRSGQPASLFVDAAADSAVKLVADSFAADLQRVGGKAARRVTDPRAASGDLVIIGVIGQSAVIDELVRAGKINTADLTGQWEAFRRIVVERPFPKVARALVIVGSDRRGAVFGAYDISAQLGVSPWHWFADVPPQRQKNVFVTAGSHRDQPKVKYRGFFINDENPAFNDWAHKQFGGINSKMYVHVFELLLRLKGNYLWPAMWAPKAFNDDDPQNMILADAMGVVMGSSHHEPMTRAQNEWHRNKDQGVTGGAWNYATNSENLRKFWRGGIERMMSKGNGQRYESVVTVGMRGDGDEAMAEGTAIPLLESVVAAQRNIIAEGTGKPASETPQIWALYKEVQDYYDHGMKVPDDVTLLFADDNWGQIRRLPTGALDRKGGYGVYYHFDYVGGPRNYKWLDTVQIEKTWQQMDLAYTRGARQLWIVNVGDIKPEEYPLSFFMDHAWNPEAMTPTALADYPGNWARATFGVAQAAAIADLLNRYSMYTARRKPELLDAGSFLLGERERFGDVLHGGEFGAMVAEWQTLEADMLEVRAKVPESQRSAYLQLVEHPIAAMSNLYQLYYAVALNRLLAASRDTRANAFATLAEEKFRRDAALTAAYHQVNGGKWDKMMSQTHIGYTIWQQPPVDVMPEVKRVEVKGEVKPIVFGPSAPNEITAAVISIEAPDFSRTMDAKGLGWKAIKHLGRTYGSIVVLPQGQPPTTQADGVRVEYDVEVKQPGDLTVQVYLSPTLDTTGRDTLRFGVSVDASPMITLVDKLRPSPSVSVYREERDWEEAVKDNARMLETEFAGVSAGKHTIKIWRLDDNVVVQKIVASTTPIPLTYLGAPAKRSP